MMETLEQVAPTKNNVRPIAAEFLKFPALTDEGSFKVRTVVDRGVPDPLRLWPGTRPFARGRIPVYDQ